MVGTALLGAATAAPFAIAALHRAELSIDLEIAPDTLATWNVVGALVLVVGAVSAAVLSGRRLGLRSVQVAVVGAVLCFVLAGVRDAVPLRLLVVAIGLVWAPVFVSARQLALDIAGPRAGWRVIAAGWAGVGAGVAAVGISEMVAEVANWGYQLAGAGAVALYGAALLSRTDGGVEVDAPADDPAPVLDDDANAPPIPREALILLVFTIAVSTIGSATMVLDHVATRWGRDLGGQGGVLALGGLAVAVWLSIGHWFNGLATRPMRTLVGVAGAATATGGALMVVGAASVTYIGLLGSYAAAATAYALAVSAVETALARGRHPVDRHGSVALAGAAAGLGGVAILVLPWLDDQISRGWIVALMAAPAVLVGVMVASLERAPSRAVSRNAAIVLPDAQPITLPGAQPVSEPLLECRGLQVGYGNVQVLFDVSLQVNDGEITALMGTNGVGKTTLLRTISGLLAPSAGTVHFGGIDITSFDPTWRVDLGISQIAGGQALAEDLTVVENLRVFGHSLGRDRARLQAGIDRTFDVFPRLAERRDQLASTLSGGEKQMLALSKALICKPRLLVIDEFSLGLAPRIVGELLPIVEQINADGTAVLLVEQSVNIALSIADHAYCMEKGEIVYDGTADRLRNNPSLLHSVYLHGLSTAVAS